MLLSHTIRHNKPATELFSSTTFLNEELANITNSNILGDHLRRVELTSPHRGGLLGQGVCMP